MPVSGSPKRLMLIQFANIRAIFTLGTLMTLAAVTGGAGSVEARQKPASIVIDANTGKTLHANDPDGRRYPASLAKMMTIYLVFEELRARRLKMSTPIFFSQFAAKQPPSKLGLKAGESITIANAIRALVTKSANDVAVAVAEHIALTERDFADRMTAKARKLGMRRTVFRNASGLPNPDQTTTARDMAKLGLALQDNFPRRYRMFSLRRFVYRSRRYSNHNRLLKSFRGTDGIKTGYTRASGFNITTSVRRNGRHVIGVVMGQRSGRKRNAVMKRLLARALKRASTQRSRRRPAPLLVARPRVVARPMMRQRPWPRRQHRLRPNIVQDSLSRPNKPRGRPAVTGERSATARRPSTLGDQRARLLGAPMLVHHGSPYQSQVSAEQSVPLRPTINTHAIQVGAFFSEDQARNALNKAQARAGAILYGSQPMSERVRNSARALYRAKFAGFNKQRALETCSKLKLVRIDCFVTRAN
jgi:D-alanyl-D-alanine carboxypeptidase